MKRNLLTLVVGLLLLLVFVVLLFTYQVRHTEVAVVTTFDKPTQPQTEPGLKFKWPSPIQKVYKFDKRIHTLEGRLAETLTGDAINLTAMVYVGWTIEDPMMFFRSFPDGKAESAEPYLQDLVESAKDAVIGEHEFADFVSTDPERVKLKEIEGEILAAVEDTARTQYGIRIQFVGFNQLKLPERVTEKVFTRMQNERQREVQRLQGLAQSEADQIRSEADRRRSEIVTAAQAEAIRIRGEADALRQEAFRVFAQDPEFAIELMKYRALEESLKNGKTTLVLDQQTPPFDKLVAPESSAEAAPPNSAADLRADRGEGQR